MSLKQEIATSARVRALVAKHRARESRDAIEQFIWRFEDDWEFLTAAEFYLDITEPESVGAEKTP